MTIYELIIAFSVTGLSKWQSLWWVIRLRHQSTASNGPTIQVSNHTWANDDYNHSSSSNPTTSRTFV